MPVTISVARKQLSHQLLHGILNVRLAMERNRLQLHLDGQQVISAPLKRPLSLGSIAILAPAGRLEIRDVMLDGTLQPQ